MRRLWSVERTAARTGRKFGCNKGAHPAMTWLPACITGVEDDLGIRQGNAPTR